MRNRRTGGQEGSGVAPQPEEEALTGAIAVRKTVGGRSRRMNRREDPCCPRLARTRQQGRHDSATRGAIWMEMHPFR